MATHTIVALFDDYREAEGAIRELEAAGIPSSDVNLIANNAGNRYGEFPQYGADRTDRTDTGTAAGTGAGIGAVLGGAAGLLAGIGALAIPGVGPIVAAGAIAATLAGAGVGAAVGGVVGALVEAGIPREHADIYAEAVRRGGSLVTVRAEDASQNRVTDILNRHGPVDVEERAEDWRRSGWKGFDQRAEPYTGSVYGGPTATTGTAASEPIRPAVSSNPISGPTDTKPARPTGAAAGGLSGSQTAPGGATGSELQRDWEVRRDVNRTGGDAGRGVRIYPRVDDA
jgi:hypothetical protein